MADQKGPLYQGTLLSYDPGHTTGWCLVNVSEDGQFTWMEFGQLKTGDLKEGFQNIQANVLHCKPIDEIVFENYRVYGWKKEQHAWSDLHTPKLIGVIEAICAMESIPTYNQPAQVAKGFCTDAKLREWGLWDRTKGQKHCRDAIRHAIYFILFGGRDEWRKTKRARNTVG